MAQKVWVFSGLGQRFLTLLRKMLQLLFVHNERPALSATSFLVFDHLASAAFKNESGLQSVLVCGVRTPLRRGESARYVRWAGHRGVLT